MDKFEKGLICCSIVVAVIMSLFSTIMAMHYDTRIAENEKTIDSLTNKIVAIEYYIDHQQADTIVVNNDIIVKIIKK